MLGEEEQRLGALVRLREPIESTWSVASRTLVSIGPRVDVRLRGLCGLGALL